MNSVTSVVFPAPPHAVIPITLTLVSSAHRLSRPSSSDLPEECSARVPPCTQRMATPDAVSSAAGPPPYPLARLAPRTHAAAPPRPFPKLLPPHQPHAPAMPP